MITSLRRLKYGKCKANISWSNLFEGGQSLYKLRSVHIRVQWPKILAHGRNSYIYQASHWYNELELGGALFTSDNAFKVSAKFKIFKTFSNCNLWEKTDQNLRVRWSEIKWAISNWCTGIPPNWASTFQILWPWPHSDSLVHSGGAGRTGPMPPNSHQANYNQ